jgi:pentatricopeptide repeat protein
MPFKPFAHLYRVGLAKGITHSYAPSVVAGSQSLSQFQNHSVAKFTKATHLQSGFNSASGSSGAGAKAGYTTQSAGGDSGLAQYYAAWQHAQQTGDDSDWKQHVFARRIGWKHSDKDASHKSHRRLESTRALDLLRPSSGRIVPSRTQSENAVHDKKAREAEDVDAVSSTQLAPETIEIDHDVGTPVPSTRAGTPAIDLESSTGSQSYTSAPTDATSPADESIAISDKIVRLGQQHRYAEIPALFEALVTDDLTPTVDAYNHILLSAIHLTNGYQPYPRALEIYGDMSKRSVKPNDATYGILLHFLTTQSLEVQDVQKSLDQRARRYGTRAHPFVFNSTAQQQQLYADDTSLAFATKLYNIARATFPDFSLSAALYNGVVRACAQAGMTEQVTELLAHMKENEIRLAPELYTIIMDAYASDNNVPAAQSLYEEYRDLAISRAANDPLDMHVYATLIKAYYHAGMADTGLRFFEKILQSFKGVTNERTLVDTLTSAFVLEGLVPHHLTNRNFAIAIDSLADFELTPRTREEALAKIASSAADVNHGADAMRAYSAIATPELKAAPALAITSMHLRTKDVGAARALWKQARGLPTQPTADFAAMFGVAFIRAGHIEEGITEVRNIFARIRDNATSEKQHTLTMQEIDEALILFGEALMKHQAIITSQAAVGLLRAMIENGGFISPITENAIASLGPECVQELDPQDIALALHVQGQMLEPMESAGGLDIAQSARFAHLLETVLGRGILMDPSTVGVLAEAVPKISATRPDLASKWQAFTQPTPKPAVPQMMTPMSPMTPASTQATFAEQPAVADTFDPYAHTTDFRASKIISEMLENSAGRIENHLNDALSRFRNVRRAGRHLHYAAYGKLITAAGKSKQVGLISEILSMTQADVPFSANVPSVRNGWVSILDSTVAAYLTAGDRQMAAQYHQRLLDMGSAPSANTFGIYITTLEGTSDEATEAVKIFQRAVAEGVAPSVFLYNAVIGKLGKARRIDDCLRYFAEMQNLGMRPSSVTYGTLVNALCRTSEESFAVEMFDEMEAAPNYRPRPAPYNSIIQYFLNTKRDRGKVLQYYERMKSRNIKPTSHTYKLLIEAYASLEHVDLDAAQSVLDEMKANGIEPEAVHYGTLIHARGCVMHDMAGARAVFDSVVNDKSVRVTDNLYQNLLEAMVANHEVAGTTEVLNDMMSKSVPMTPYIANTLIHGWAGEGNVEKAKAIFDQLGRQKREPSTYEAMTRAFLSVEDHESAKIVVGEMLGKGYPAAVSEKVLALIGVH